MPATTPHGYPYAEPTDPLVQWPATSQALAEKVDQLSVAVDAIAGAGARILRGYGPTNAGNGFLDVTFDAPFAGNPTVVASIYGDSPDSIVVVLDVTPQAMRLKATPPDHPVVVNWIAVGV